MTEREKKRDRAKFITMSEEGLRVKKMHKIVRQTTRIKPEIFLWIMTILGPCER